MDFNIALNNFSSGVWSPKMKVRSDTEQYAKAAQIIKNGIVQMQGGCFQRPGTQRINLTVGDTTDEFQRSLNESQKLRTFPWTLSNGKKFIVVANENKPSNTNQWFAYETTSGEIFHINCSEKSSAIDGDADFYIDEAQYAQVGDLLFIVSRGAAPRFLKYTSIPIVDPTTGETTGYGSEIVSMASLWEYWTDFDSSFWSAFPFGQLQSGNIDGTITITGTFTVGGTVALVSTKPQFKDEMVGNDNFGLFKFYKGGNTGVVALTAVTDTNHATAEVLYLLPGASGDVYGAVSGTAFQKSAWNGFDGWPRTICSFQGRLYFGGNTSFPDTVWGSRIGNVFSLDEIPFAQADDFTSYTDDNSRPFTITPNSGPASNIRALSASKVLMINTNRNEIEAYGVNGALGPNDFDFESSTSFGAENVQPVHINNFLTFVQRGGRKLRDIIFSFDESQYKSGDLSFVADHLTVGDAIKEMTAVEIGSSVLFARTFSGKLLSVTLDRDYQVNAWSEHVLGGVYDGGAPQVLALAALPADYFGPIGLSLNEDALYILTKRTLGDSYIVNLEKLARFYDPDDVTNLAIKGVTFPWYLDSFTFKYSPLEPGTIRDLTDLEEYAGTTVSVVADGAYIGDFEVTDTGTFSLPYAVTVAMIGYKYQFQLKPMPLEGGVQIGSPQGILKRASEVFIRFWNSGSCEYGTPDLLNHIEFREPGSDMSAPVALFTGDKLLTMPPGYDNAYSVLIQNDIPVPCNVLALVYKGAAYG